MIQSADAPSAGLESGGTLYEVWVKVTQDAPGAPFFVQVFPERILLDGKEGNTIKWEMLQPQPPNPPNLATFQSNNDIQFVDPGARFEFVPFSNGIIRARTVGVEPDGLEKVYTYTLTVHLQDFSLKVDPEVDNPPPPVTGP